VLPDPSLERREPPRESRIKQLCCAAQLAANIKL
jgi:hypothetical protein